MPDVEDCSTAYLHTELARRHGVPPDDLHPWTREGLVADLRTAFYARNASRFEALLAVIDGGLPFDDGDYE